MFWSIGQFPELDRLEPHQRAQVLARVPWWTYPIITARAVVSALLLSAVLGVWLGTAWRSSAAAVVCIALAVTIAIGLYAFQLSRLRAAMRKVITEAFRGSHPSFCFQCGYDLRGSDAARCPECGGALPGGAAA